MAGSHAKLNPNGSYAIISRAAKEWSPATDDESDKAALRRPIP